MAVSWSKVKSKENQGDSCDHKSQESLAPTREAIKASRDGARLPWFFFSSALLQLTVKTRLSDCLYIRFLGGRPFRDFTKRLPLHSSTASFTFPLNPFFFPFAGLFSSSGSTSWFSEFPDKLSNCFNASFASGLSFSGVWMTNVT